MRTTSLLCFGVLSLSLALAGCTCSAEKKILTEADNGATVYLKVGETFELRLERVAGGRWYPFYYIPRRHEVYAIAEGLETVQPDAKASSGAQVFRIRATAKGEGELLISRHEPGGDSSSVRRFKLYILVSGKE